MFEKIGEISGNLLFVAVVIYLLLVYYGKVGGRDKVKAFQTHGRLSLALLWSGLAIFISLIIIRLLQ